MQAVVLTGHGGLDKLVFHDDWPTPVPEVDDVLIHVGACGLNNTDVNTRSAWYSKDNMEATTGDALAGADGQDGTWGGSPVSFPRIQGADVAGIVEAVGPQADVTLIGQRVLVDGWLRDWSDPMNLDKTSYFGSECDGGYAEYTKVSQRQVTVYRRRFPLVGHGGLLPDERPEQGDRGTAGSQWGSIQGRRWHTLL